MFRILPDVATANLSDVSKRVLCPAILLIAQVNGPLSFSGERFTKSNISDVSCASSIRVLVVTSSTNSPDSPRVP